MFEFIWTNVLYLPLYNLLMFFYTISPGPDMGLGLIFFTVFIRVVLLPLSIRSARSEHRMERLEPAIDAIKERYRNNVQKQREVIKSILAKNRIGVMSALISIAFQLLIFIVLYTIFSSGLQEIGRNTIYSWNLHPKYIDPNFFDWFNLIIPNQLASLFAAGVVLLHQSLRRVKHISEASTVEKALIFGLPIGTYLAVAILPSAKAIFIATSVLFSIWIRLVKWIVIKYVIKEEKLKKSIDDLWTN